MHLRRHPQIQPFTFWNAALSIVSLLITSHFRVLKQGRTYVSVGSPNFGPHGNTFPGNICLFIKIPHGPTRALCEGEGGRAQLRKA